GLEYAHEASNFDGRPLRLVHRNIAPANVIIGWDGVVKVLDFGIAQARLDGQDGASGIVGGHYGYMAPEQAEERAVAARADLYSVGVVLWELLTGVRRFPGQARGRTARAHPDDSVRVLRRVRPEVPQTLADIVARALAKDPTARFKSAAEMRETLETRV